MDPPTYPFEETSFMNGPLYVHIRTEYYWHTKFNDIVKKLQNSCVSLKYKMEI